MANKIEYDLVRSTVNTNLFILTATRKTPVNMTDPNYKFPDIHIEQEFIDHELSRYLETFSENEIAEIFSRIKYQTLIGLCSEFWSKSKLHMQIMKMHIINYINQHNPTIVDMLNIIVNRDVPTLLYLLHDNEFVEYVNARLLKYNYKFKCDERSFTLFDTDNKNVDTCYFNFKYNLKYFDIIKTIIEECLVKIVPIVYSDICIAIGYSSHIEIAQKSNVEKITGNGDKITRLTTEKHHELLAKYVELENIEIENKRKNAIISADAAINAKMLELKALLNTISVDKFDIVKKLITTVDPVEPKKLYTVDYSYVSGDTADPNKMIFIRDADKMIFIREETYYIYVDDPKFEFADILVEHEFIKMFCADYDESLLKYQTKLTGFEAFWTTKKHVSTLVKLLENLPRKHISEYIAILFAQSYNNFAKFIHLLNNDDFVKMLNSSLEKFKINVRLDKLCISGINISYFKSFDIDDKTFKYPNIAYDVLKLCFDDDTKIIHLSNTKAKKYLTEYADKEEEKIKKLIEDKIAEINKLMTAPTSIKKIDVIADILKK